MDQMKRFAVYYSPRPGAFAMAAAAWLGWDVAQGQALNHPVVEGLPAPVSALTSEPRKYGFHATLRAPFRLAHGAGPDDLHHCLTTLAAKLAPVRLEGLELSDLDGFLALLPRGDQDALMALAAQVVEATNALRADLTAAERARRRPETLSPRQKLLLNTWGYPFVMEQFRFHLTLTNPLPPEQSAIVAQHLRAHFAPVLPTPFEIQDICLFGEDESGRFHLLHRYALSGNSA
jgi:putative phosphonate metabolism protein